VSNTQTIKLLYKSDIRSNNGSDIATLYDLSEILAMEDIRQEEKDSCVNCCKDRDVKGFIWYAYTPIPLLIPMSEKDYEVM
jgi:hypothetical protein